MPLRRVHAFCLAAVLVVLCACGAPGGGVAPSEPSGIPALAALRGREAIAAAGRFSSTINASGGELWTAVGTIVQDDIAGIVARSAERGDEVHILTGVHGAADGALTPEAWFFAQDLATFGQIPGVSVWNVAEMSSAAIQHLVHARGTTIGAFCNSAVGLAPWL
jgi:hypothetical protein